MKKILVIGTIFLDCKGFAAGRYDPYGRNIGDVKFIHGGVGRNVAENLASLNFDVQFVSTVDNTMIGSEVIDTLQKQNIRTDYTIAVDKGGMGIWMVIMDSNGNQVGAISQMPDITHFEKIIKEHYKEMISECEDVVLEIDLNVKIAELIIKEAKRQNKKIYTLPANMEVVLEEPSILSDTECFICNNIEAGRLLNKDTSKMEQEELLKNVMKYADKHKIKSMVVTMGEKGSVYFDSKKEENGFIPALKTNVVDTSGAGDAFFSGTVAALVNGFSMKKSVENGTAMASLTIQIDANTFSGIEIGR